jgi:hypothetical protein
MRVTLLFAAALALSACGKNNQADTNQNFGENLTAESIVSNDVTAIDAVTGDAANMAADVDMNYGALDENNLGADLNAGAPRPRAAAPSPSTSSTRRSSPAPATSNPTTNAGNTANTATNAE